MQTRGLEAALVDRQVLTVQGLAPGDTRSAAVTVAGVDVFLLLFIASYAVGLGPVFWLMISEIYPLGIRSRAMSIATIANWAANFVVSYSSCS